MFAGQKNAKVCKNQENDKTLKLVFRLRALVEWEKREAREVEKKFARGNSTCCQGGV